MMMSSIAIVVLLLVLFGYIYLIFLLGAIAIDLIKLIKILNISSLWRGTWWQDNVSVVKDLILEKFPIGAERIFTGKYISHWEIARFEIMSVNCELDIPVDGGWDWLIEALGNPTTRAGCAGTFNLEFRGKLIEEGCFGHRGMCSYRIEVIEIISVKRLT